MRERQVEHGWVWELLVAQFYSSGFGKYCLVLFAVPNLVSEFGWSKLEGKKKVYVHLSSSRFLYTHDFASVRVLFPVSSSFSLDSHCSSVIRKQFLLG